MATHTTILAWSIPWTEHTATHQTSWLKVEAPLLLMGTLVEDKGDGSGGSIPSSLEYLILEPPLISAVVPLSQV